MVALRSFTMLPRRRSCLPLGFHWGTPRATRRDAASRWPGCGALRSGWPTAGSRPWAGWTDREDGRSGGRGAVVRPPIDGLAGADAGSGFGASKSPGAARGSRDGIAASSLPAERSRGRMAAPSGPVARGHGGCASPWHGDGSRPACVVSRRCWEGRSYSGAVRLADALRWWRSGALR